MSGLRTRRTEGNTQKKQKIEIISRKLGKSRRWERKATKWGSAVVFSLTKKRKKKTRRRLKILFKFQSDRPDFRVIVRLTFVTRLQPRPSEAQPAVILQTSLVYGLAEDDERSKNTNNEKGNALGSYSNIITLYCDVLSLSDNRELCAYTYTVGEKALHRNLPKLFSSFFSLFGSIDSNLDEAKRRKIVSVEICKGSRAFFTRLAIDVFSR